MQIENFILMKIFKTFLPRFLLISYFIEEIYKLFICISHISLLLLTIYSVDNIIAKNLK